MRLLESSRTLQRSHRDDRWSSRPPVDSVPRSRWGHHRRPVTWMVHVRPYDPLPNVKYSIPPPVPIIRCDECGDVVRGLVALILHYETQHRRMTHDTDNISAGPVSGAADVGLLSAERVRATTSQDRIREREESMRGLPTTCESRMP